MNISRRELFRTGVGAMAVAGAAAWVPRSAHGAIAELKQGATVLFQGDSITDAGRDFEDKAPNDPKALGSGYAALLATQLLDTYPTLALQVFNRGVSGNKIPDLAARWQDDVTQLHPDVLSILIGVNDVWHKRTGNYRGTLESYENGYASLLKETRAALPEIALVICEPFVLRCGVVDETWLPEIDAHRAAAKRVADDAGAIWVPFQEAFDDAIADDMPPAYWARDGVHPTAEGHALMARTWLDATGLGKP